MRYKTKTLKLMVMHKYGLTRHGIDNPTCITSLLCPVIITSLQKGGEDEERGRREDGHWIKGRKEIGQRGGRRRKGGRRKERGGGRRGREEDIQ